MFVPSVPISYLISALSCSFARAGRSLKFLTRTYALDLMILRPDRSGLRECTISNGVFQSLRCTGIRLRRRVAYATMCGQSLCGNWLCIRSFLAVLIITPPERSARPFCSGVSGGVVVNVMPLAATSFFHSLPRPFSLSEWIYRVVKP